MIRILDKDIEYLFPTEERMEKWFKDFNARFFNNELEQPELCVGWLKIGTLGCFLHPKLGRFTRFNPAECTIILNGTYFMQAAEWENTFLPEMIHYNVFKEHGFEMKQGHGKEFKREAKRIGAMSDYSIDKRASLREVFFRPNQAMLNAWVRMERNEFVIGIIQKIRTEIFYDEETDISCPIDLTKYSSAFKTTDKFIPEIIENLRGQKFRVFWYSVKACCQKLLLLRPCTYSIPRGSDYLVPSVWGIEGLERCFGKTEVELLGETLVNGSEVSGYCPGTARSDFREKYHKDAAWIAHEATERFLARKRWKANWFNSRHKVVPGFHAPDRSYRVEMDLRSLHLMALTPRRIDFNPTQSDAIMQAIHALDAPAIEAEIQKVIELKK